MTSVPFTRAIAILAPLIVGCSDDSTGPASEPEGDESGAVAPEIVTWLQVHGKAFSTPQAGSGFADLQFLEDMIGNAKVVALGEATHGTREFFQMKHRILEYLVQEMGFDMQYPGMALHNVIEYLSSVDPPAAAIASEQYTCLLRYANGPDGSRPSQTSYRDQSQSYRDECQQDLMEVRDSLLAHQDAYVAASSAAAFALADRSARVALQYEDMESDRTRGARDEFMAENAIWIHEQGGPDSRIVLWAHNGHGAEDTLHVLACRASLDALHRCRLRTLQPRRLPVSGQHSDPV